MLSFNQSLSKSQKRNNSKKNKKTDILKKLKNGAIIIGVVAGVIALKYCGKIFFWDPAKEIITDSLKEAKEASEANN